MAGPEVDEVYRAISHPVRRGILDALRERERAVKDLIPSFGMSQPAVSQHLSVLREAGLVRMRRLGQLHVYSVDPRALQAVLRWVRRFRADEVGSGFGPRYPQANRAGGREP